MFTLGLLTVTSCLLCLFLTPLVRHCSIRLGLVDRPDHARKFHPAAVPRTGGVAILLSCVGAYALLLLWAPGTGGVIAANRAITDRLLPPVALIFLTGLLDDWLGLKPWQKLLGQVGAAAWACGAGVRVFGIGGHHVPPWCGGGLTVAWLVLCSNAFNLIDGIDGLAAGVGLTATLTTLTAGLLHGDFMLAVAAAPLAGCLLGFLRYNFNPASIFLGDCGSLSIGFLLGAYGIVWSQNCVSMVGLAAPAMALGLPLLEVCLSVMRRFLASEPIFSGDRGHIHHRLLERGFTPRRVALLLYGGCGVAAALSLLQSVLRGRYAGVAAVLFGVVTWAGVHCLNYLEFGAAARFLRTRLRPMLSGHVKLERLARWLESASSVEECWQAVERAGHSLGYSHINARLAGRHFASGAGLAWDGAWWQMRLNLPGNDYVNVTRHNRISERPMLLIPFVELLGRSLPQKLAAIQGQRTEATPRKSSTTTVMSSDWGAPSVNAATPS
jgi:UDP-GlcNAc:undecaprenyl-phosphate/decaprenyl-phosphate GlcNAc-1-phosphate transferase